LDSSGCGQEPVAGCCEHGKELSGSIKCGKLLGLLNVLLASQKVLCSIELVDFTLDINIIFGSKKTIH
jgi:hypothetical protein